jgi:hypothetical protein
VHCAGIASKRRMLPFFGCLESASSSACGARLVEILFGPTGISPRASLGASGSGFTNSAEGKLRRRKDDFAGCLSTRIVESRPDGPRRMPTPPWQIACCKIFNITITALRCPGILELLTRKGDLESRAEGLGGRVPELRDGYNWPSPNLSLGAGD